MQPRVRFAPSPTGHLHVGGARTAIFNWLFARHHGGAFIVRVEDTDQARSTLESEQMVLDDLRWLGLQWDEGPDVGGPHAPYRQSERTGRYDEVASEMVAEGQAYRCFCSEAELEAKRRLAEAEQRAPHYDLTCYHLSGDEVAARVAVSMPHAIRFHVPKEGEAPFDADVTIHDIIRGEVSWAKETLGDFILVRSDGLPTYNFSVVVDDHDMAITHVIRAEEHLTNTHRQVLIYRSRSWDMPEFAHVSLILGQDRTKLSKRHGATSVSAYADEGFLADAMVNYLTLLGWSTPDEREIFTRAYAIENFSLGSVNPAPAVFDPQKFEWLNGQYIHAMPPASLRELLLTRLNSAGWVRERSSEIDAWLDDLVEMARKKVNRLNDLISVLRFVFEFDAESAVSVSEADAPDLKNQPVLADPRARPLIEAIAADFREHGVPGDEEAFKQFVERMKSATGLKGKDLFLPLRIALTGSTHGPELQRAVPLMERGSRIAGLAPIVSPRTRVERIAVLLAE
jgi:nondiscriminating glutamyl-tRNA synthetase